MRETFDVVIVGGGHNGLAAALRFLNAGLSVCVAEARAMPGGCAVTTEPLLPGFRHSPHANAFLFADVMPSEISPAGLDVPLVQPDAQFGAAFADGRPPVILHRRGLLKATEASLGAYSRSDASTFVRLKRRADRLDPVIRGGLYAPPSASWFDHQQRTVSDLFKAFDARGELGRGSARRLIDDLFETPEIRLLLYVLALETGVELEAPGSDLAFLGYSLWIAGRWRLPIGGMQAYSDALVQKVRRMGGEVRLAAPVDRVLVEQGRAVGVRIADADVLASKGVVSAAPALALFDRLLEPEQVSATERAELDRFRATATPCLGVSAFCLDQAPRYRSGAHDPEIDRCLKVVIGFETPDEVLAHAAEVRGGLLPRPAGVVRTPSLWDRTLAPGQGHAAAADSVFPSRRVMDASTWRQIEAGFPAAFFDMWRQRLLDPQPEPPMTLSFDDVLAFERRMLLRTGDDEYRTSVPGLYLAGPGVYPGGGVHGACGRNAAETLMGDLAG